MVLRKFQHGAVCFPRRLAPLPLPRLRRPAPNGCYLFRLTLPNVQTPGANLHSMLAPPLHHGGVPMVVGDHTRGAEAQFRPGACPHIAVHQTHNHPLRPKKNSTLSQLKKTRPEGSCSPAPQCPIPHAGMARRSTLPSPAHSPHGSQLMGTPLVALQHVTHRPTAPPPRLPAPPPPLPDKVAHKPPKRPRPPSPEAHTKAQKDARQTPRPVPPLSLKRSTARQPQPEPPPPKRPLTIRDMFKLPPPSTSTPPRRPRPRFRPFSPHNKVLRTRPPLPREHKLTIVLTLVQHVISLKKPHLHVSLRPALDSPNSAQPISTTTLAVSSHFCKYFPPPSHPPCSSRHALTPKAATVPPSGIRQRPRLCVSL